MMIPLAGATTPVATVSLGDGKAGGAASGSVDEISEGSPTNLRMNPGKLRELRNAILLLLSEGTKFDRCSDAAEPAPMVV